MNTDHFDTNIEEQVSLARIEGLLLQIGAEIIFKKYRDRNESRSPS
ncbi:MAG: hypothetical protein JST58_18250 [Bacteroidetes bacterium]|nr:hypothetical protein [Bacteroidota bacterium]